MAGYTTGSSSIPSYRSLAIKAVRRQAQTVPVHRAGQSRNSGGFSDSHPNRQHAGYHDAMVFHNDGVPGNATRLGQTYKPPTNYGQRGALLGSSRQNVRRQYGQAITAAMRRKPPKGRPGQ